MRLQTIKTWWEDHRSIIMSSLLKGAITCLALLSTSPFLSAQDYEKMEMIASVLGAEDPESLDEQEVERLSYLLEHPLDINNAPRSKLLASGLLSRYQIASLDDYRSKSGDVLSVHELASLEGFGEERARQLAPFLVLRTRNLPGQAVKDTSVLQQTLLSRVAIREDAGKDEMNYGIKHKVTYGEWLDVSMAARSNYGDKQFPPSSLSGCISVYGRDRPWKAMFGDINTRFGQGLNLWSGMSMTGFSSTASFCRHPTGLSPSWSYSGIGSHRGMAAEWSFGRLTASALLSFPGLRAWCNNMLVKSSSKPQMTMLPAFNLTWYARHGQLGLTACLSSPEDKDSKSSPWSGKVSMDGRWAWKGIEFFGETALPILINGSGATQLQRFASVIGITSPLWEDLRLSIVGRSYPSDFSSDHASGVRAWTNTEDERGIAFGLERHAAIFTADFAQKDSEHSTRQCKLLLKVPLQLSPNMVASIRATERYRPYEPILKYRTGARCDLDWSSAGLSARYGESEGAAWKARFRLEGVLYKGLSGLTYVEAGRKTDKFSAYLRGNVFIVDNWDDRIYSYERDAPGNFTVPAYYGRGWALSAVAGWKTWIGRDKGCKLKLYLRASTTQYPWMPDGKTKKGRTEIKFQATLDF